MKERAPHRGLTTPASAPGAAVPASLADTLAPMGQQQLLLLILGVVLVGLAVVVGIEAFDENERKSALDAMTNDAIRISSDIQAWSLKPVAYGGPEEGDGFTDVTLSRLGYTTDAEDTYATQNGRYALTSTAADCVRLVGVDPADGSGTPAEVVQVVIRGPQPGDIETAVEAATITC